MKIKEFINTLKGLDPEKEILLSCDEELNTLFKDLQIAELENTNYYVIWGNSGSEVEI